MLLLNRALRKSIYSSQRDVGTFLSRIRTSYSSIIITKVSPKYLLIIDIASAMTALAGIVIDGNCSRSSLTTSACSLSITL